MGFIKSFLKEPLFRPKTNKSYSISEFVSGSNLFPILNFSNQSVSNVQLIDNWEQIADIFAITDWTTNQIANIPTKIVDRNDKDTTNTDLESLQWQPNPYQNWPELMKTLFGNYEILGTSYLYGIKPEGFKQVSELHSLPAASTGVIFEGDKSLPAFLNTIVGYKVTIGGKDYTLPVDEVLQKRYPTLRYENGLWAYGISKYIPADKISKDLRAIYDSRTSIVEDRGALGVLSNKSQSPNPENTKAVQDKLAEKYGVRSGQRKFIVTTEDLSFTQMGLGIAELQLIENANYDFNKLCQINGFDPVIFSTEGSTFANKEMARKDFIRTVLIPRINDFYQDFNQWLSPQFGFDKIVPDWDSVPELKEDKSQQSKQFNDEIRHGVITRYKAHQLLYGVEDNMPEDKYVMSKTLSDGKEED